MKGGQSSIPEYIKGHDLQILLLFRRAYLLSGLSYRNIAENLGCSYQTVCNILQGRAVNWLRYLPKIIVFLRACGCRMSLNLVHCDFSELKKQKEFKASKVPFLVAV